jgi:hypothetical protein
MRRLLGMFVIGFALFGAAPAYAQCQPGWGLCRDGTCAPLGSVCCNNGTHCPGGHICTREHTCLWRGDPRVCRNGFYCYSGEYCGADNRCYRRN